MDIVPLRENKLDIEALKFDWIVIFVMLWYMWVKETQLYMLEVL